MKGMNSIETVRHVRAKCPDIKVLMLFAYISKEYVMQALNAATYGYVLNDSAMTELEQTMQGNLSTASSTEANYRKSPTPS